MRSGKSELFLLALFSILLLTLPLKAIANVAYVGTIDYNFDDQNDYTGEYATENYLDNYIQQTIDADRFSLSYNFFTWDGYDADYQNDTPGFSIHVDGLEIYAITSNEISTDSWEAETLDASGWQEFSYEFDVQGTHTITLYAGNTEDDVYQSWVMIDELSPFVNGDFETGDLSGWETGGQAGVVPIPGAIWLLGSGVLGIAAVVKRKNN